MKAHAAVACSFNTVMTDQNAVAAQAVVEAYDFSGLGTLVDVGGGHGSCSPPFWRHPPLRGILYDQPHVVAGADRRLRGRRCG